MPEERTITVELTEAEATGLSVLILFKDQITDPWFFMPRGGLSIASKIGEARRAQA